jgi:hypothetical protein
MKRQMLSALGMYLWPIALLLWVLWLVYNFLSDDSVQMPTVDTSLEHRTIFKGTAYSVDDAREMLRYCLHDYPDLAGTAVIKPNVSALIRNEGNKVWTIVCEDHGF